MTDVRQHHAEKNHRLVANNMQQLSQTIQKKEHSIHHFFEVQVEQTADAVAVVYDDQHLTYCELNRRANQLARCLHKQGVGPDILVGLCFERSLDMIIALLAILKAGGAYVPLDPLYPGERLAFMLANAHAPVVEVSLRS